jgi:hypothetical protein
VIADCVVMVSVAFDLLLWSDPRAAYLNDTPPPSGMCGLEVFCCTGEELNLEYQGSVRLRGMWKQLCCGFDLLAMCRRQVLL